MEVIKEKKIKILFKEGGGGDTGYYQLTRMTFEFVVFFAIVSPVTCTKEVSRLHSAFEPLRRVQIQTREMFLMVIIKSWLFPMVPIHVRVHRTGYLVFAKGHSDHVSRLGFFPLDSQMRSPGCSKFLISKVLILLDLFSALHSALFFCLTATVKLQPLSF